MSNLHWKRLGSTYKKDIIYKLEQMQPDWNITKSLFRTL